MPPLGALFGFLFPPVKVRTPLSVAERAQSLLGDRRSKSGPPARNARTDNFPGEVRRGAL